jgi:hypothetical protein
MRFYISLVEKHGTGLLKFCQSLADAASLECYFSAWLNYPANWFYQSLYPYVLVYGTIFADNWADLIDGSLINPIDQDENGDTSSPSKSGLQMARTDFNHLQVRTVGAGTKQRDPMRVKREQITIPIQDGLITILHMHVPSISMYIASNSN